MSKSKSSDKKTNKNRDALRSAKKVSKFDTPNSEKLLSPIQSEEFSSKKFNSYRKEKRHLSNQFSLNEI